MIFHLVWFLILFLFTFYPSGFILVAKSKDELTDYEIVLLSLMSAIVVFVVYSFVLGVLELRVLLLPTVILISSYSLIRFHQRLLSSLRGLFKDRIFNLITFICLTIQGFINFPSGFRYPQGYLFWSSQGHDGLWHVALMEEIKKTLPIMNPIYAGEKLVNYHYLVDIFMGEFGRIFPFFSSLDLYFRFFTVILSFLIVLSVFTFLNRWQSNKVIGYLAIFFTILVGSFGYLVTFFRNGNFFSGETIFWAAQGNSIIGNPPHAISFSLITTALLCLYFYFKTKSSYWFFFSALISAFLSGFKVPGGMVFLFGLGTASVINFVLSRDRKTIVLAGLTGLTNFMTVKLLTRDVESFLIWQPWWFIRTMIVVPERLGVVIIELKRQHYLAQKTWHANLRVLQLELGGLFIFIIGNLGLRIIGVYELFSELTLDIGQTLKKPLETTLIVSMLTGLIIPLLFVQKGLIYNNIAFMQYFLLIFGFYGAIAAYKLLLKIRSKYLKIVVLSIFIFFSVPTVLGNLVDFYGVNGQKPALAKISNSEIVALNYLRTNSAGNAVILSLPFDKNAGAKYGPQPWPIYAWYSTAYISALSSRRTYLTSEEQALITGYNIQDRLDNMHRFFSGDDPAWNQKFLSDNNISYIYLTKAEKDSLPMQNYLSLFFENNEVVIYKVI